MKNTPDIRLSVLMRHRLKDEHPLCETHHLIKHTNESCGEGFWEIVPHIVGMSNQDQNLNHTYYLLLHSSNPSASQSQYWKLDRMRRTAYACRGCQTSINKS